MKKAFCLLVTVLIYFQSFWGQENELTIGFQFKPIIPTDITNSGTIEFQEDFANIVINPKFGYSWGAVLRKSFTPKFSLETGLSYVRRNFDFQLTDLDSAFTTGSDVGLVNYEIPIQALYYVQLGENFYMNNSLGISLDMYASDVGSVGQEFSQVTFYRTWLQPSLKANVGFEYRTEKSGFFYLGITFHNPFDYIALSVLSYRKQMVINSFQSEINGGYLTADLRFFFPQKK
ncbi:MAG: hypothetical protein AAF487_03625 [Bacteroidota bacterium]